MGKKLPVVSISKLVEALRCPRCAWLAVHEGVSRGSDHGGWRTRDRSVVRQCFDRSREAPAVYGQLGWSHRGRLPRPVLLVDQEMADRFRYRLKYFDAENGFFVRGQIDDALWALRKQAHIPVKISFPGNPDREIGRLERARLDECVRLLRERGLRVQNCAAVAEYFSTPALRGAKSGMPGWRCKLRVVRTSARRSEQLHRKMRRILALSRPPRASKGCGEHHR